MTPFIGRKSKVKFTRPFNAVTENQPHLRNGKAYELQTWVMGGVR